ncbi:sensor histidine kinase [Bacillus thermotolerans]|uniref:sensor histidine kinase n=1 Tax=Bacillus thermotolerans TaxID=1221996 RepID=UPI00057E58A4|nr:ATP-binding protein [Bacillus thermotolerans]KKB33123.1 Sensory box histidine kinase [Bacillus thermotolerans]KKB36118.1 Sensory box histidine kinase [Bacillus thermotolerans]
MGKTFYPVVIFSFIAISAIYLTVVVIAYPLIGLEVHLSNKEKCTVVEIYPHGWANYHDISNQSLVSCEPDSNAVFKLEKIKEITLYMGEEKCERIPVTYKKMPVSYLIYSFLPIIYFILCFVIALYVILRKRFSKVSVISSYLLLLIGLAYLGSGVSARGDLFGVFITLFSLYLIPTVVLEYLRIMVPKKDRHAANKKIIWLYVLIFAVAVINTFIGVSKFMLAPFFFMILAVPLYFIIQFSKIKKSIHLVKIRFFIWTVVVSLFPFILLSAIPEALFEQQIITAEHTALFLLLIPISFIYITAQKVFFDFDLLIKRASVNFFLSLIPAVVLAGGMYAKREDSLFIFQLVLLTIILVMILLFVKDFFATYLAKGQRKFPDSLMKLSQMSSQIHDQQALFLYINQVISDVLHVDYVKKIECRISQEQCHCEDRSIQSLVKKTLNIGDLREIDNGYALLVGKNSVVYTFITFSYKKRMTQLNNIEKGWLKSIAHYINILIENFRKTEELVAEVERIREGSISSTVSRTLFLIGEKERVKLAHDIHDSILQELIFIHKNIELIQGKEGINLYSLEKIKEQLSEQIDFIRSTCYDLNPFFLKEFGLIESLYSLVDKYRASCEFEIDFQISQVNHFTGLSEEVALTLYRIVQELMNNAKKHSKANFIHISLSCRNDQIMLVYEDDGVGLNLKQEKEGNHFGLLSLNERIRSMSGDIFIYTEPDQGLLLKATIPK